MLRVGRNGCPRMPTRDSGRTSLSETQRFELSERTPMRVIPSRHQAGRIRYLAAVIIAIAVTLAASPLTASAADDPLAPYTVDGVTPRGTTINLFDYWLTDRGAADNIDPDNIADLGINAGHVLDFNKNASRSAAPYEANPATSTSGRPAPIHAPPSRPPRSARTATRHSPQTSAANRSPTCSPTPAALANRRSPASPVCSRSTTKAITPTTVRRTSPNSTSRPTRSPCTTQAA